MRRNRCFSDDPDLGVAVAVEVVGAVKLIITCLWRKVGAQGAKRKGFAITWLARGLHDIVGDSSCHATTQLFEL